MTASLIASHSPSSFSKRLVTTLLSVHYIHIRFCTRPYFSTPSQANSPVRITSYCLSYLMKSAFSSPRMLAITRMLSINLTFRLPITGAMRSCSECRRFILCATNAGQIDFLCHSPSTFKSRQYCKQMQSFDRIHIEALRLFAIFPVQVSSPSCLMQNSIVRDRSRTTANVCHNFYVLSQKRAGG